MSKSLPRAGAFALWAAGAATAHVAAPILLSRRGRRYGWRAGRPGDANRTGLVPLAIGIAGLVWCYAEHDVDSTNGVVNVSLTPDTLLHGGPYKFSRNPMYVAELTMWIGWTAVFGSPYVLGGAAAL